MVKSLQLFLLIIVYFICDLAFGHNISGNNAAYLHHLNGASITPLMYLGAKHMVTGVDHLLYLLAVVFFLRKITDVLIFASLFTLGHSITLLAGVIFEINANEWLIDAIIGLSVVYKAFENLEGFKYLVPIQINPLAAVFTFGLFHGFGLATKIQSIGLSENGKLTNIVSFNIGVEIGQFLALLIAVALLLVWKRMSTFNRQAFYVNGLILFCGFLLTGYHLTGYFFGRVL